VPHLAARRCGSAHAGALILDGQTEQDIVGIAETECVGALPLRGFQQPVPAFRLKALKL
jgi:class 3 adenylate cyclase